MMQKRFELYGVGRIGPKGQVVIPAEAREELGFQPGDKVMIVGMPDRQSVIITNEDSFNEHLSRMRERYEMMSKLLEKQTKIGRKNIND